MSEPTGTIPTDMTCHRCKKPFVDEHGIQYRLKRPQSIWRRMRGIPPKPLPDPLPMYHLKCVPPSAFQRMVRQGIWPKAIEAPGVAPQV